MKRSPSSGDAVMCKPVIKRRFNLHGGMIQMSTLTPGEGQDHHGPPDVKSNINTCQSELNHNQTSIMRSASRMRVRRIIINKIHINIC